jgi:hypothetical protein
MRKHLKAAEDKMAKTAPKSAEQAKSKQQVRLQAAVCDVGLSSVTRTHVCNCVFRILGYVAGGISESAIPSG